ncbi:MAG: hypothetical protein JXJ04_13920 [Spirochaetales bacterium]|nr:hypothetical protein [Spirochaetales bacterium]
MKPRYIFPLAFGFLFIILLSSCSKERFDFDYDPPSPDAILEEIFPGSIKGSQRSGMALEMDRGFRGYKSVYLDGKITMEIIKCPGEKEANYYFGTTIVPEFKSKKVRHYDNFNNRWKATGTDTDGRKWIAWVNYVWIFRLSGQTEELFNYVVRVCSFVS